MNWRLRSLNIFDAQEASHGSVGGYMRHFIGINEPDIDRTSSNSLK